ncbi:MAG: uracil-DNA glycosylase [Actinomycetota bacterium]|nr:uracil-DNA glycosylase [Actinomycetota bacterium]MDA3008706.1 uracil-DNA glycosylase [Actinomycetota bacterium]MDA3037750.1 uracil-DNA glycosylase [Actinomycetota bacterium]
MVNRNKFQILQNECSTCVKCSLSATRNNVVFGRGNPNSKLFVIGEGPGQQEDEQGLAFVGRAGKMLDSAFFSVGIDTNEDCYISNIVKCRPPKNRKPLVNEVKECIPWLNEQIELIKPKVIVLAGSTAVQSYLNIDEPISKLRGKWIVRDDIKYMPIFHPSYLLRNPSKEKGKPKWLTWQDLKKVKKEVNSV